MFRFKRTLLVLASVASLIPTSCDRRHEAADLRTPGESTQAPAGACGRFPSRGDNGTATRTRAKTLVDERTERLAARLPPGVTELANPAIAELRLFLASLDEPDPQKRSVLEDQCRELAKLRQIVYGTTQGN